MEHITEPLKFTFEVSAEDLPRLPEAVASEYRAKLTALGGQDEAKRLYETALNKLGRFSVNALAYSEIHRVTILCPFIFQSGQCIELTLNGAGESGDRCEGEAGPG